MMTMEMRRAAHGKNDEFVFKNSALIISSVG